MGFKVTFRQAIDRLALTPAVALSAATQIVTVISAPLVIFAITRALTPEAQGFYYTFNSISNLQVFAELGLGMVITQFASHEWAHLAVNADGTIGGDDRGRARLGSLLRLAVKWYSYAGIVLLLILAAAGTVFLSQRQVPGLTWRGPWLTLCVGTVVALFCTPILAIMEGCGEVVFTGRTRLLQSASSVIALVAGLWAGFGLYAMAMASAARSLAVLASILLTHRKFLWGIFAAPRIATISWQEEIWPFQWKIGVSWLCGYFIFSLFVPVLFYYSGPVAAGQFGMTLTLAAAVEMIASSWISPRVPSFGGFIARREFRQLDRTFGHAFQVGAVLVVLGAAAVALLVGGAQHWHFPVGDRVLPLGLVAILLLQRVVQFGIGAMAVYLRAHKREPLLVNSVVNAILIALSTWQLGKHFGAAGAVYGFTAITLFIGFPWCLGIFYSCRREWHAEPADPT